jgi:hypothetical protein
MSNSNETKPRLRTEKEILSDIKTYRHLQERAFEEFFEAMEADNDCLHEHEGDCPGDDTCECRLQGSFKALEQLVKVWTGRTANPLDHVINELSGLLNNYTQTVFLLVQHCQCCGGRFKVETELGELDCPVCAPLREVLQGGEMKPEDLVLDTVILVKVVQDLFRWSSIAEAGNDVLTKEQRAFLISIGIKGVDV